MRDLSHIGGFSRQGPITAPVTYKEIPVGLLMELTFSECSIRKFPGISGIVKGSPSCFPVGNFPVEMHFSQGNTSSRLFTANLCHHLEFWRARA